MFLLLFLFSPSLRCNITHCCNCHFSMLTARSFFPFFKSYLQFYPSRKALVITTHAFTIIINLNSFFTNPILIGSKDRSFTVSKYLLFTFFFSLHAFFLTSLVAICFFFHFPLAFFFFFFLFLLGALHFFLLVLGVGFLFFLFFLELCVFSLSLSTSIA